MNLICKAMVFGRIVIDMFSMHKPGEQEIRAFISARKDAPFSYHPAGITRDLPAPGFNVDHNRVRLGSGRRCFEAAKSAIRKWKMFDIGWVNLCWSDTPIESGATVAIVVRHLGFWSMNSCRIVYTVEKNSLRQKYGFAYGTLSDHAERGEERFTVEWNQQDDSIWYDILAISKPGPLARLGYPYARRLQKRFAEDSKKAMIRSVAGAGI